MYRVVMLPALVLAASVVAQEVVAQEKAAATNPAKLVAPFLDEQTVAVVQVNLGRIDVSALLDRLGRLGDLDMDQIARMKKQAGELVGMLRDAGVERVLAVFRMERWPDSGLPFLVVPLGENADKKAIKTVLEKLRLQSADMDEALIAGDAATLRRVKQLEPTPHPELAKAFAAVTGTAVQGVVVVPRTLGRALEETLPTLPAEVGGGSIKVITRNVSWKAVGLDLTPKLGLKVVVQTKDADAARALSKLANSVLDALAREKEIKKTFPDVAALREMFTPQVKGSQLRLELGDKELVAALIPALVKARFAARRAVGSNNLKQMALAMHNYLDVYKTFPAHASYDKQGKPLLSWRVHILPFIEQENLYRQFHLDEPWDSAHNKKLIAKMPRVYQSPFSRAGPGKTTYVVPIGKNTIFPADPKGVRIQDITDGTSNTIMIMEADDDHAVIWTRPEDLRVDPKQPLRGLGGKAGRFLAAFADGSVHAISRTIELDTLRALFTRNGGEVLGEIP
jgi:hypothetical protein